MCWIAPGSMPRPAGSATFSREIPRPSCSSSFTPRAAELLPPRLAALEGDLRQQRAGLPPCWPSPTPPRRLGSGSCARWRSGCRWPRKGDAKAISFVEDTAVAPENLRDYIAEFLALIARHGTKAGVYAHASVGCLHVRPVINLKTEEGVRKFETIAEEVADLVLKYGGALSGEHGDGLVRSPFQEKMYGPVLYQAFRELKRTFDPLDLFNPGKIVDAPPLTANLRYGPGYVTPDGGDHVRLLGRWRPAAGRRAVRGRRRLSEEARGDDVPLVSGDA